MSARLEYLKHGVIKNNLKHIVEEENLEHKSLFLFIFISSVTAQQIKKFQTF